MVNHDSVYWYDCWPQCGKRFLVAVNEQDIVGIYPVICRVEILTGQGDVCDDIKNGSVPWRLTKASPLDIMIRMSDV